MRQLKLPSGNDMYTLRLNSQPTGKGRLVKLYGFVESFCSFALITLKFLDISLERTFSMPVNEGSNRFVSIKAACHIHSNTQTANGMADKILLADGIASLCELVDSGVRGVLLTGADDLSRRSVARTALPRAQWVSCAKFDSHELVKPSSPMNEPSTKSVILTSADSPGADGVIRAALAACSVVVALATSEDGIAPELRRAGRLDYTVILRPPSFAARLNAWKNVISILREGEENGSIVREIASASPAFGLVDFRTAVHSVLANSKDRLVDPLELLATVRSTRPSVARGLEFASYGSGYTRDSSLTSFQWTSVGGYDSVKTMFSRLVEWPVRHADAFKRLGVSPPKGLLLYGPGGCGKTLLAEQLIGNLFYANWIRIDGIALFSPYLGESERRIRALFAQARALEPCIVFIDDIEAVGGNRGAEGSGVERRVLGALLAELDGTASGRVFLLGCTRVVGNVDSALMRSGRIDSLIEVGLPSLQDRLEILRVLMRTMRLEFDRNPNTSCSTSVDKYQELADRTQGFTGAGLSRLCREAAMIAMQETAEPEFVSWEHFETALVSLSKSLY
jgi:SpoVK/Ycf46/Vps4 family AAA+-type ATPase